MLHFRILEDGRIQKAIKAVEESNAGHTFLDILAVLFQNLPQILAALHDPMALVKLLMDLLAQRKAAGLSAAGKIS